MYSVNCVRLAGFLVVYICSSLLFQSIVMSYVDCGDDGWVVR